MTDIQWLRIRSCLNTCSGLYVDNEARGRPLFVEALYGMAHTGVLQRRRPAYGKWNSAYRRSDSRPG